LELSVRSVFFAAVGTCGQRCTSLRRLILHKEISQNFLERLVKAYNGVKIGDPLEQGVLCGPLHSKVIYILTFFLFKNLKLFLFFLKFLFFFFKNLKFIFLF
jgi:hypothetical protein